MAKSSVLIGSALAAGIALGAGGMGELGTDKIPDLSEKTRVAMEAPDAKALETGLAAATVEEGVPVQAYVRKGDGQAPQPYLRCQREMRAGELFEVLTTCEGEEAGRVQYLIPSLPVGQITKAIVTVSFYNDVPAVDRAAAIAAEMEAASHTTNPPVTNIEEVNP